MSVRLCVLWIVLLSIVFVGGCYTVLKHPEGVALYDDYSERRSCSDCHQASWFYHQDPYWYGAYYYGTYYPYDWYYYYGRPWWYDNYWFYYDSPSEPVETGQRHMWSPPSLRPPEQISIPPALKVPDTKQTEGSSGKQTPSEDKKPKEKDQDKRHLWGK
jgi:hypothetical protein